MSVLQQQAIQRIRVMSDDKVSFLLEIIDRLLSPYDASVPENAITSRIGVAEHMDLYDSDYDFDEDNDDIAKLFGVTE